MPFGATVSDDGSVSFRLWAPAARDAEVIIGGGASDVALAMMPQGEGWFELVTTRAARASRYCYRIDGARRVPDPASRYNPFDVHAASEVIDPLDFEWDDAGWTGRPWDDAVIYELHVGAFTAQGSYAGVESRLDYLAELGVTAIELMPLAAFPGSRDWGYDGALPFAPDASYGHPDELKRLVQSAHRTNLMVFIDVVYNHFGPEGNYLHTYAPQFFTGRHHTPWGAAINYDGADARTVRDFFIHNALYWLEEFNVDGLRLDAVDAICDDSRPSILEELAEAVQRGPAQSRHVHLVVENDRNDADYLERDARARPRRYVAQWNDDFHHAFHAVLTGETDGYYADYAHDSLRLLGRSLTEGYAFQGESSQFRGGRPRGKPSRHLPQSAFVAFLQNHDQVGNRALGERLVMLAAEPALAAAVAVLLLAPSPPLLFMGEEFGARTPFLFFCDFGPDLAPAVTAGRRREFARFAKFSDPAAAAAIPDPCALETFERSKLDWTCSEQPAHAAWLERYRTLLALRRREIVPLLPYLKPGAHAFEVFGASGLHVHWRVGGGELALLANLGGDLIAAPSTSPRRVIYACAAGRSAPSHDRLAPWSVQWSLSGYAGSGGTDAR